MRGKAQKEWAFLDMGTEENGPPGSPTGLDMGSGKEDGAHIRNRKVG